MAAEPKTVPTNASVEDFLNTVADPKRREDCFTLLGLMKEVTGAPAVMWGPSIVGFGTYRYCYESGRVGDWPVAAFSPRKAALTLYIMSGFAEFDALMARLGKHTTGKACLYVKHLADIDLNVLRELVEKSTAWVLATQCQEAGG